MRRWFPLLLLLLAAPTAAVQTFLGAGGMTLSTGLEQQITPLATTFTVASTAEGYFILASIDVSNPGSVPTCSLRIRVHNVSGDFADQSVEAPIPANGVVRTVQVPVTGITGATFGLGSETVQVFATKTCSGPMSLDDSSYLLISSGGMPGGVIVSLNGQTGAVQTFTGVSSLAPPSLGLKMVITSSGNDHTFRPSVVGAGTDSTVAGISAVASGTHDVCVGNTCVAAGGSNTMMGTGAGLGTSALRRVAIGELAGATTGANDTTCVGYGSACTVADGICVGSLCDALGAGIGIGKGGAPVDGICIGQGCIASSGKASIGGTTQAITELIIGKGLTAASVGDVTIHPTDAVGTNIGGATTRIGGARGTGTAAGGDVCLATSVAGSSGSTLQTLTDRFCLTETGILQGQSATAKIAMPTNAVISFGTASNATFTYDGTNLIVNPKVSGSGFVDVKGTVKGTGLWLSPTPGFGLVVESAHADVPQGTRNVTSAAFSITASAESPYVRLTASASFVLTSAPTITNGVTDGQLLSVSNEDASDCITFQDNGTLGGSNLELCADHTVVTICGPQGSLQLQWSGALGEWKELGCHGPTPTPTNTPAPTNTP